MMWVSWVMFFSGNNMLRLKNQFTGSPTNSVRGRVGARAAVKLNAARVLAKIVVDQALTDAFHTAAGVTVDGGGVHVAEGGRFPLGVRADAHL